MKRPLSVHETFYIYISLKSRIKEYTAILDRVPEEKDIQALQWEADNLTTLIENMFCETGLTNAAELLYAIRGTARWSDEVEQTVKCGIGMKSKTGRRQ